MVDERIGALDALVARRPLLTTAAILAEGIRRIDIDRAIARGTLIRHGQGIMCSPGALADPQLDNAAACLATGGVICAGSAGHYHGLTDELPAETEVLVPATSSRGDRFSSMPIRRVRSRMTEALTVGVEEVPVLGTTLRITGKARTVVDLFRIGARQHAVSALHTYLSEGGTAEELRTMAEPFGAWQRLVPVVEMALEGVTRAPSP